MAASSSSFARLKAARSLIRSKCFSNAGRLSKLQSPAYLGADIDVCGRELISADVVPNLAWEVATFSPDAQIEIKPNTEWGFGAVTSQADSFPSLSVCRHKSCQRFAPARLSLSKQQKAGSLGWRGMAGNPAWRFNRTFNRFNTATVHTSTCSHRKGYKMEAHYK